MDEAETDRDLSLRCMMGWHGPEAMVHWNHGYYFSRCRRCGIDLVRTAYGRWQVPRGFRVVWSDLRPAAALAGAARLEPEGDELPIEALLRNLKDEPSETPTVAVEASDPATEDEDVIPAGSAEDLDAAPAPLTGPAAAAAAAAALSIFPDFMGDGSASRPLAPAPATWGAGEFGGGDRPSAGERFRALLAPVQSVARKSRDFAGSGAAQISQMASRLRPGPEQNWTQPLLVLLLLLGISAVLGVVSRERSAAPIVARSVPTAAPASSLPSPQSAFVAAQLLNCREAPSLQAGTVRRLERGDQVAIQALDQDWANIAHQRGQCWVLARYLSIRPPLERG